jgi:hypothetical protein
MRSAASSVWPGAAAAGVDIAQILAGADAAEGGVLPLYFNVGVH